jgi:predicted ester cyclase
VPCHAEDGQTIYFGSTRSGNWQIWNKPAAGAKAVQVIRLRVSAEADDPGSVPFDSERRCWLNTASASGDNFVRPFIAGFPGNVHAIRNLALAPNLVAVEWTFEAVHSGTFADIAPTGKQVQVPGCSFYEYDLERRTIPAGRIYFDVGTLLRQIGA